MSALHIEAEFDHVAVLNNILFSFEPKLAGLAGFGFRTECDQIVKGNNLRGNEPPLEIAVNDSRRCRGLIPRVDRPSAGFFRSGRQIGAESEQVIGCTDQLTYSAVTDPEAG